MLIIQILNVKEKSNQDGHKKGTENSIKNSQNHSFLICVFQKYRKGGILAGGCGRCDTGVIIEPGGNNGNQEKREKFSHKIAHKGNTSQFRASQTADSNSRKTVPAHPACHSSAFCRRNTQDHGADQPSDDRAHRCAFRC